MRLDRKEIGVGDREAETEKKSHKTRDLYERRDVKNLRSDEEKGVRVPFRHLWRMLGKGEERGERKGKKSGKS